ncbi:hypothetical protein GCM10009839_30430 [Catenulispora yoronensis]|uniref:Uncharacterized protein n=1 Tax=Catenulispora yoronensis TaxID=450799 RepID=A0ABP5FL07_9ACTN
MIETFNHAVRRPGMFYGDRALGVYLEMLAYLDGDDEEAFRRGWLRLSRELSDVEYFSLIDRIPKWQVGVHLASEVLLTHGPRHRW